MGRICGHRAVRGSQRVRNGSGAVMGRICGHRAVRIHIYIAIWGSQGVRERGFLHENADYPLIMYIKNS
jgi:hypothetical protein